MYPTGVRIAIVCDNFSPHLSTKVDQRHFTLGGTDHPNHEAQGSMIRRYISWRNRHTHDPKLRRVVERANRSLTRH